MRDDVSIRVTFSKKGEKVARQLMKEIETRFGGITFGSPRKGSNPKYKPGGTHYDPSQGEFQLSYSRCRQRNYKPVLPSKKRVKKTSTNKSKP